MSETPNPAIHPQISRAISLIEADREQIRALLAGATGPTRERLLARLAELDSALERVTRTGTAGKAEDVRELSEADIRREYPIADRVSGWFFRISEVSPGVYRVEGTDLWGRQVGQTSTDEQDALHGCIEAAKRIKAQIIG